jgi:hypothetical protein
MIRNWLKKAEKFVEGNDQPMEDFQGDPTEEDGEIMSWSIEWLTPNKIRDADIYAKYLTAASAIKVQVKKHTELSRKLNEYHNKGVKEDELVAMYDTIVKIRYNVENLKQWMTLHEVPEDYRPEMLRNETEIVGLVNEYLFSTMKKNLETKTNYSAGGRNIIPIEEKKKTGLLPL